MTAPNRMIRKLRRELERELRELPAPSPPAGLLDAIRREIPAELAPAKDEPGGGAATPTPWRRRPLFRLAASLAVVAIGLALALRVGERPAPSDTPSSKTVRIESAPLAPAETVEASSASSSAASSSATKKEEDSLKGKKERQRNLDDRASTANSATPPPSTESLSSLSGTPRGRRVESADVGQAAAAAPAPPAPAAAGAEL
ncbi:MAG TPA: hypothetical protein VI942_06130, partial [Thermoanaerobaculia bacterium]|nr:hypothetical protein [Thermoanaerobaculia bacterium]